MTIRVALVGLALLVTALGWAGSAQAAEPGFAELQQQEQRLLTLRRNLLASLNDPDRLIMYAGADGPPLVFMTREELLERLFTRGLVQPPGGPVPSGLRGLLVELPEAMAAIGANSDRLKDEARNRFLPEIDRRLAEVRRAAAERAAPVGQAPILIFDRVVHDVTYDSKSALGRLIHIDDITADETGGRVHLRIRFKDEGVSPLTRSCEETYQLRWSITPEVSELPRNADIRVDLEAQRTSGACKYGLYSVELSARGSEGALIPPWLRLDKPRTDVVTTLRASSAQTGGSNERWSQPGRGTATIRVASGGIPAGPQFRSLYFWVDLMARTPRDEATVNYRFAYVMRPE